MSITQPIECLHESTNQLYPTLLREIPVAPAPLYYKGILPQKDAIMIAIVGTRKASYEGKLLAKQYAYTLAQRGIIIVSGLALGIDAAAHEGALSAHGTTIAVLAHGLHTIYPAQHESLAQQILASGGCFFSEYEEGTPSLPHQFLERNRIVSGLSCATIVIEAPLKSGALVTARNAIEQGREVFVVPGSSRHPNYRGSHMLIREGARLVTSCEDVIEDLALPLPNITSSSALAHTTQDTHAQIILRTLTESREPLSIDTIITLTTLEPHIVNQTLTFLTLENSIEEHNGVFSIKS